MQSGRTGLTSIISVNDDIRHVTLPEIQVAENKYPETGYVCEYVYPELTALCPTSRLPDFYNITIAYEPDKRLPELKSLKYYFVAFRNVAVSLASFRVFDTSYWL